MTVKQIERKAHEYKLATRDFIHRITGQTPLIDEYYGAMRVLWNASDYARPGEYKKAIIARANQISESRAYQTEHGMALDGYDPYKLFQNRVLKQKIAMAHAAIAEFGLAR